MPFRMQHPAAILRIPSLTCVQMFAVVLQSV